MITEWDRPITWDFLGQMEGKNWLTFQNKKVKKFSLHEKKPESIFNTKPEQKRSKLQKAKAPPTKTPPPKLSQQKPNHALIMYF